jgi:signal transduction histidine kinase/HAMP domain-containing protein/ActR/RegA family two-component response regulator
MLYLLIVLIAVGVVAAGGLGYVVPRRIVRPLAALQKGAQEIGAGRLDHVIEVQTGDEMQDLAESFNQMAANLRESRDELETWGRELEIQVEERTRELAEASDRERRRAGQLQISAEVSHAIASVRDLDQLLPEVTQLIGERFGWYHVGIFLLDAAGEYAVLRAANSEGGRRLLARAHKLKVGEVGIVGSVTGTGEPRIALDVGDDAVYFDNPDMPETRSEMALPLRVGDQIIGALDVQSKAPEAYDEEDVSLLSNLADQVAIAIENARLFRQTQDALEEVQKLHRQYVEREWTDVASRQGDLTYEYRRAGTPALADQPLPEVDKVLAGEDVVVLSDRSEEDDGNGRGQRAARAALAAPIKLRDRVIGVLDLQETESPRDWTNDEITLVQAVSDQVALALENARLFADTQRRAEQLATLQRIGLTITSALNLDEVLTALHERIERIMDASFFYVALYDRETGLVDFPLMFSDNERIETEARSIGERPGITGHIIQTGQPLHIDDLSAVPDDAPYRGIYVSERQPSSFLGVPLEFRDEVFGVLSVQSHATNAYTEADVDLLATIATQASIAIQNARAYERLVETAEELREIDRLKTQFLANMSHELRTPLNSIIGFSRVLLKGIDGPLTELQQTDLTSIYSSGQHLLGLINDILDMSKIEAGKMELAYEEVQLQDIFKGVLSTSRALVKDQPVDLRTDIPDDLPTVWADSQRVRQVLINLMSNAAKFTDEGYIALRAGVGDRFVTISVQDTGVGIEPEAQKRLFIPFQQVDGSTTRRAGGTGLGLAISRSYVEMHGGEIWVESEPGKGSTFVFTLPIYGVVRERKDEIAEIELDPNKKAILAVDDDAGVISLLRRYLEHDGYQVIGVMTSSHALEKARGLAPHLAAITLDVVMPNMDGWEVLRALKRDPETKDIPVVLCSIVEGLEQGLHMGASACLRKPVTRDEVLETLERVECAV